MRQPKITFFCGGEGKCLYYNSLFFNEKIMIVVASFLHSVLICVCTKLEKENHMSSHMFCELIFKDNFLNLNYFHLFLCTWLAMSYIDMSKLFTIQVESIQNLTKI
jgi:hypothetical protein